MLKPALLFAVLLTPLVVHADEPPVAGVARVAIPARAVRKGKNLQLTPRPPNLVAGDRVITGAGGRVALQLPGGARIRLGGDSDLLLHSVQLDAADGGGPLARLAVLKGAARLDATKSDNPYPSDVRLNVGPLKLRALGSEIWVASEKRGETVCLLQGAVEIVGEFGSERMDVPGNCLLFSASNRRLLLKPDVDDTLARKLAQTAFADDSDSAQSQAAAMAQTIAAAKAPLPDVAPPQQAAQQTIPATPVPPAAVVAEPPPKPAASAPAPAAVAAVASSRTTAATAEPASQPGAPSIDLLEPGWTVIVASLSNLAAARSYASRLRALGLPAQAMSGNGKNRVLIGRFTTREQALDFRAQLQREHGLIGGWVSPF